VNEELGHVDTYVKKSRVTMTRFSVVVSSGFKGVVRKNDRRKATGGTASSICSPKMILQCSAPDSRPLVQGMIALPWF